MTMKRSALVAALVAIGAVTAFSGAVARHDRTDESPGSRRIAQFCAGPRGHGDRDD